MNSSDNQGPPDRGRDADTAWIEMRVAARLFGAMPRKIGRYTIQETLGSGGMGLVYRAHDPELERTIAVKLLNSDWSTPEGAVRLNREARAMARLSHPNVVQVYEAGKHQDRVFLAMEYVEGETLEAWLSRGQTPAAIHALFLRIGEGVAAAHSVGVTHRDLKPSNILIDARGTPKVADFGLARTDSLVDFETISTLPDQRRRGAKSTANSLFVGTLRYMAPEQHDGRIADARSDQFTYCLMLWEALCGERPFPEPSTVGALDESDWSPRPPPRGAGLTMRARQALMRGLQLVPAARWPAMPDLLAELARPSWAQRHWKLLAIAAAAVLSSAGAGVAYMLRPETSPTLTTASLRCEPGHAPMRLASDAVLGWRATLNASSRLRPMRGFFEAMIANWYQSAQDLCESAQSLDARRTRRLLQQSACLWSGADLIDTWLIDVGDTQPSTTKMAPLQGPPKLDVTKPVRWAASGTLWRICPNDDAGPWHAWGVVLSGSWKKSIQAVAEVPSLLAQGDSRGASERLRALEPRDTTAPASLHLLTAELSQFLEEAPADLQAKFERAEDQAERQRDDISLIETRLALAQIEGNAPRAIRRLEQASNILARTSSPPRDLEVRLLAMQAATASGPRATALFSQAIKLARQVDSSDSLLLIVNGYIDRAEAADLVTVLTLSDHVLSHPPLDDETAGYINYRFGMSLISLKAIDRARRHFDAAIQHYERLPGRQSIHAANVAYAAAVDLYFAGESAAGRPYTDRAIHDFRESKHDLPLVAALYLRSAVAVRTREPTDAVLYAREALTALEAVDKNDPEAQQWPIALRTALVEALVANGEPKPAIVEAKATLREIARSPELEVDELRDELELALAKAWYFEHRPREALRALRRLKDPHFLEESDTIKQAEALALRAELPGLSASERVALHLQAREILSQQGQDGTNVVNHLGRVK